MTTTINAIGDKCPIPVVKAKKALDGMKEGTLEVLVDNTTAVTNLKNLATKKKCIAESEQLENAKFVVRITVNTETLATGLEDTNDTIEITKNRVVVISSNLMGNGDDKLGYNLMKAFVFALTQQEILPTHVLMYNSGVKLACEGSESLNDLKVLEELGVVILSCGTCLDNFALTDKLAVGQPTNMYVIVETQLEADTIIRP